MKNNNFFPTAKQESTINLNRLLDETDWYTQGRFEVLYQLNIAKFSRNDNLKYALLSTGHSDIIALSTKMPWYTIARDTEQRFGSNRLGKMMMSVRDEVKEGETSANDIERNQQNDINVVYTTFHPDKQTTPNLADDAVQPSDKNLELLHEYGNHNNWDEKQVVIFPRSNSWLSNRYTCTIEIEGVEYDSTEKAFQVAKVDYAMKRKTELQLNEKEIKALEATKNIMQSHSSIDLNDIVNQAKVCQFRPHEQRLAQKPLSPK
jgi:predicted NAD-dependent protein-ADP-ribosyltransferase YbiA (DUF1768 family)